MQKYEEKKEPVDQNQIKPPIEGGKEITQQLNPKESQKVGAEESKELVPEIIVNIENPQGEDYIRIKNKSNPSEEPKKQSNQGAEIQTSSEKMGENEKEKINEQREKALIEAEKLEESEKAMKDYYNFLSKEIVRLETMKILDQVFQLSKEARVNKRDEKRDGVGVTSTFDASKSVVAYRMRNEDRDGWKKGGRVAIGGQVKIQGESVERWFKTALKYFYLEGLKVKGDKSSYIEDLKKILNEQNNVKMPEEKVKIPEEEKIKIMEALAHDLNKAMKEMNYKKDDDRKDSGITPQEVSEAISTLSKILDGNPSELPKQEEVKKTLDLIQKIQENDIKQKDPEEYSNISNVLTLTTLGVFKDLQEGKLNKNHFNQNKADLNEKNNDRSS